MNLSLNENQLKAVKKTEGPLRIIAGPGSGKTRTIVSKIVHILNENLATPDQILAITFTNKAANEIKKRIKKEKGIDLRNIYTYHGWCHYFLRREYDSIGLSSGFTILDSNDSSLMIKKIIDSTNFQIDKNDVITAFEKIGREELKIKKMENSKNFALVQISNLWNKYVSEKKANGNLDFNDLITEVKKLLLENEYIKNKWSSKYKYIFIDEFQDTNNVQFEIIKSLTNSDSNITVVGDPDQNIYSWRGANINIINNFNNWYPNSETIYLDTNYRSTPEIINASNFLIKKNKNRVNDFFSNPFKDFGKPIEIIQKSDEYSESNSVSKKIKKLNEEGFNYEDIAIIVRSSYKTRNIESSLNYLNIPYRVIGAMKFYDRSEVKKTLKFLLFIAKQDNWTLSEIINSPSKKFGPKKIEQTIIKSDEENLSMWEWLKLHKNNLNYELKNWVEETDNMIKLVLSGNNIINVIQNYFKNIGFLERLFDEQNRQENIKEVLKIVSNKIKTKNSKEISNQIINFYNDSLLSSSADKSIENGQVNIITAHASKGTEFKVVFLYSFVEGHWPSSRSIESGEIEEERRVAYVAMTRAMDRLIITLSSSWNSYGKETQQSRFLDELLQINKYNYSDDIKMDFLSKIETQQINFKVNDKIFHNKFGQGIVIDEKDGFITVKFYDGKTQEILNGHKSCRKIK